MMKIDGYLKDIAATTAPVNAVAASGAQWKFARNVFIRCPSTNTSDLKIGSKDRQEFTVVKGTVQPISEINRAGQSGKYDLREIMIKAGTNGDDVEILVSDPSND